MTFLPIVERELRVASRRRWTYLVRSLIAFLPLVMGGALLILFSFAGPAAGKGKIVFGIVSDYIWLVALLAGVFLASDSLSEERREGTLGLLFLTDLRGYDVVLGKFAAVSLNAFYGMLAVFPVLAVCFLAGGVTAGEFWRTCLALLNSLFFSVAAAMWVSSLCKVSYRAMAGAIFLLVSLTALGFLASTIPRFFVKLGPPLFFLRVINPAGAIRGASQANYLYQSREYWVSLAANNAAAWMFLCLAGWQMRFFRESASAKTGWRRIFSYSILGGKSSRRSELLEINPILWFLDDSRHWRWITWGLAILGGITMPLTLIFGGTLALFGTTFLARPIFFLLDIFFAVQACRFFSESRRTGALELLSCTPMQTPALISGQWKALSRLFLWPVIILIISQLLCLGLMATPFVTLNSSTSFVVSSAKIAGSAGRAARPVYLSMVGWYPILLILMQIAEAVAKFFALGWFGMWLALSLQRPALAAGLTILFVLILPDVAVCIPNILIDAIFIVVGSAKLKRDFRSMPIAPHYRTTA